MIASYKKYCDSIHYQPFSKSMLWRTLNGIGPSQRKCLAGLDNVTKAANHAAAANEAADNAPSYQGTYVLDALYKLCSSKVISLKRYVYNEPQCGKYQHDRESAGAKSLIPSFVDAGNDVNSSEDVAKVLNYGSGLRNFAVAGANIEIKSKTTGITIPSVKSFCSFEFHETKMKIWRYFDIGEGLERPYNKVKFESSATLLQPFHSTEVLSNNITQNALKRSDSECCKLHFCPEYGCKDSFETEFELECHVLSGKHSGVKKISTMNQIKESFINRMKGTITSPALQTSSIHFETSSFSKPVIRPFNEMG